MITLKGAARCCGKQPEFGKRTAWHGLRVNVCWLQCNVCGLRCIDFEKGKGFLLRRWNDMVRRLPKKRYRPSGGKKR